MEEFRDLDDMIEILGLAIARQEAEEAFFRRSAGATTHDAAKALFEEIADELADYRRSLEERKRKLLDAKEAVGRHPGIPGAADESGETVRDPVCGMRVDPATAKYTSTYRGRTYYFCASGCKIAFDLAPEKYVKG